MQAFAPPYNADLPALKPGDLVAGRFRIVEVIGSGGFSVVYRAHQEGMNRFVALKVLKPRASADAKIVERFRREALFASQLSHTNTITLFDYGQTEEGLCYIAMEFLRGRDLSEEVKHGRPMNLKRVWSILTQTCRSLAEAHRMGLIHRDLKPENIFLVDREGGDQVKVLDFGVSKALSDFGDASASSLAPLTQEGTVFGTPLYMAPEQAMAEDISPAVDVYAIGHIAYEMITGRAAYDGQLSPMDVMLRQINDPALELPPPFDELPFSQLIQNCTQKDPYKRIRNAGELLEALLQEPFVPYMDLRDIPPSLRQPRPVRPLVTLPAAGAEPDEPGIAEDVYRWELSVLGEMLQEVQDSAQMRLAVLRGNPGTGRSNLLRSFLRRQTNQLGVRLIHRQSHTSATPPGGLEADLAQVAGLRLRGDGIKEVNRLLREFHGEEEQATLTELMPVRIDSNPLSELTSLRDAFLSRMIEPFRRASRVGSLIWGIENLETADTLTLAFLDRFVRELQVHPAPILVVVTVHPDALAQRPGLMRYTETLLNAPATCARQLRLLEPGARKEGLAESSSDALTELADLSSGATVDGSYPGGRTADDASTGPQLDDVDIAHWAAQADGVQPSDTPAAEPPSAGETPATPAPDLATDAPPTTASPAAERAEMHQAFDSVLGYLAQLDERVVERPLWEFVYHRVLPFETTRVMGTILEQAERFGILRLTDETLAFADQEYARNLREHFSRRDDAIEAHHNLAALLHEYSPEPGRQHLRRIVHHAVQGHDFERAISLLIQAGESAYEELDLDSAREHFLQFKALLDDLSMRSPTPPAAFVAHPRVWLRLGEVQGALGEHGAAEDALLRAIREARENAHPLRASAHKLLADLAMSQTRYEDALHHYELARDLFQKTSLARPYVATLAEIGRCSVLLGRPRQAEGILLQSIDKAEKLQDNALRARQHRYMGDVLTRQGRFLEAIDHLKRAMEIFDNEDHPRDVVSCLQELGQAHFAAGLFDASRNNYTRALALTSTHHLHDEHTPHLGLARALAALENLQQAELHLVEAMSFYGTRNDTLRRARVQYHLGDLYLAMGRPTMAHEHYEHVFYVGEETGQRELAFNALVRQAYACFDLNEDEAAFAALSDAVTFAEEVVDEEQRAVARAHIIYLQLLGRGFNARGEFFSTLLVESPGDRVRTSTALRDLFRADVALARGELSEAATRLSRARLNAASLGSYGLFIPLARREHELGQVQGRLPNPHTGSGYAIGSLVPPEIGRRRFGAGRIGARTS
ncbi:hypothetical protein DL240_14040 [Lujinxingia litoralis]|uniref:Protein kinase domain-containing protein n=1 Tax=Lujinxingia litoralis TaxID=2211119 RepID=A0A328C5P9_9DELT|nr:serine/threonine-protein kinase [Lujinxingia litoralis]RAL21242.1 hypothetical protein DL240_14040 [Lujinxingia litoralis]